MMKRNHIVPRCLAGALLLCAAASLPASADEAADFQEVLSHLDVGGSSLEVFSGSRIMPVLESEIAATFEMLESFSDEKEVAQVAELIQSSGLLKIRASGSSSLAVEEDYPVSWYRSRGFLKLDWQDAGWLWNSLLPANRDLTAAAAGLPETTLLAFNWEYDFSVLPETLKESDIDPDFDEILDKLAGIGVARVELVLFTYDDEDGDTVPGIKAVLPDTPDLDTPDAESEVILLRENGLATFFSSREAMEAFEAMTADGDTLGDTSEFERFQANSNLAEAVGFLYVGEDFYESIAAVILLAAPDDEEAFGYLETAYEWAMDFDDTIFATCTRIDSGVTVSAVSHLEPGASLAVILCRYLGPVLITAMTEEYGYQGGCEDDGYRVDAQEAVSAYKQVLLCMVMYANDHDDQFPSGDAAEALTELFDGYLSEEILDLTWETAPLYLAPGRISDVTELSSTLPVLIQHPQTADGKVAVGFLDGHVELVDVQDASSYTEVISLLHSRSLFPAEVFQDLVNRASQADEENFF